MTTPSLLIQFDPETWTPEKVFYVGRTDEETEKLKAITDEMLANIKKTERSENAD